MTIASILCGVAVLLAIAVAVLIGALRKPVVQVDTQKQEALFREMQELHAQVASLQTEKAALERERAQLKEDQTKLVQSCQVQFENVANKIFNEQKEVSRAEIAHIITPLNKQLEEFSVRQAADKAHLASQITRVAEANHKVQEITEHFVNALLNKPQQRGKWGEDALRQLLTDMGFREGREFFQQVVNEEDKRPDFIVLLPNKQAVIIDAKTVWDKYYEYMQCKDSSAAAQLLKEHVSNIRKTITQLTTKKYKNGLKKFYASISADMPENPISLVLMFVNPEAALSAALAEDPAIMQEAQKKEIALVSVTTLVSTLQIIDSLWSNYAVQESNEEIKSLAEKVVSELAFFLGKYKQLGKHLQDASAAYENTVATVGETNKTGLLLLAQQLADLCPTTAITQTTKNALRDTGFDGSKKNSVTAAEIVPAAPSAESSETV